MKQKMKKIYIACTMVALVALLGVAVWLINRNTATEGVQKAKNRLNIEWYDENEKEFTITTADELYDLAKLSTFYDFKGQTIYLGADIVVNEGNAEDWDTELPERMWDSIGGFAGTFDGQGHTISGLCSYGQLYTAFYRTNYDYVTAGLFRNTSKDCVIKNFKLVNSFFMSDLDHGVGSISSNGGGTFDSIYSDATIVSYRYFNGGIIGRATEDTKITNCWFDGTIDIIGGYGRYTGGIMGYAEEIAECTIEHCLFSGVMNNDLYKVPVQMGGIVGAVYKTEANVSDCLVSGELYSKWSVVGSIVGNVRDASTLNNKDVYTTKESFQTIVGNVGETSKLNGYPVAFDKETLKGVGGYEWTTLDFENYWTAVPDSTPVLKQFATEPLSLEGLEKKVDVSWYNDEQDTFVLNDFADLYGFAILSNTNNFKGKTVKLGANITINEGKASSWAKEAPNYKWICIGSNFNEFEGTFDGQMHTISGVYFTATESYSGFFGVIGMEGTVKNFSLKNSYFQSDKASFGSIAGRSRGKLDTIYSNAIVVSNAVNLGGLVGQVPANANVTMNNCWFDGSVTNTSNDRTARATGGLIGAHYSNTKISNCLNSGTIDASVYTATNSETSKSVHPRVGGLIGFVGNKSTANISYCMNVGEVKYNKAATSAYGSIVGHAESTSEAKTNDTYATSESCKTHGAGNITGGVIIYDKEQLIGYGGYKWTTLNFQKYWSVVLDDTSILRSFASKRPSLDGVARMIDTSWYNKNSDTYVLYDAADLYGFALISQSQDFAGKTVKLGADITVNTGNIADWKETAPECNWISISTNSTPFEGTFDGQMHTISGIYLNTDTAYSGLFGVIGMKGTVKNFRLKNSYFESKAASFGSIAGRCRGTIDTVYSNAVVVSSSVNVGGIIGQVPSEANVKLKNCWFDGLVTNTSNDRSSRMTGGLIGAHYSNTVISNCLNTGTIDASVYTATNSDTSTSVHPRVGGLIGFVGNKSTANISGCMNVGEVKYNKAATSAFGSIVGHAESTSEAKLKDTYATRESCKTHGAGNITGGVIIYNKEQLIGYGGYHWTTLDFQKYWAVVTDTTPVLKSFDGITPDASVTRLTDTSWYNEKENTYVLTDAADLYGFSLIAQMDNFKGKTVNLGDDIVLNTGDVSSWNKWMSAGSSSLRFAGTFDGQMHDISGMYVDATTAYAGFFGATDTTAIIKNFSLTNSYINSSTHHLGSVVGQARGTIDTVYSNATVSGKGQSVGGFVGSTDSSHGVTMTNCWFDGSVTSTNRVVGGLLGNDSGGAEISNCLNTATVTCQSGNATPIVGGLVGQSVEKTKITNCLNTKPLSYKSSATSGYGLIVGRLLGASEITGTYSVSQSGVNAVYASDTSYKEHVSVSTAPTSDITGTDALAVTAELGYEKDWVALTKNTPVLKSFVKFAEGTELDIDISWYDAADTYTLTDAADLYGFALLSNRSSSNGFYNKTIALGDDITINPNGPNGWDSVAPDYEWGSIGVSSNSQFKGTFDGNGYKIIGVYLNSTSAYRGLFGMTDTGSLIKDLSLTDSYFYSTTNHLGSIVGQAKGTIHTVYSDATVSSKGQSVGGFVGSTPSGSGVNMTNCWFDGSVSSNNRVIGGMVGNINAASTFISCLNSGDVSTTTTNASPIVGGLFGQTAAGTVIKNCLNTKEIRFGSNATSTYGTIAGRFNGGTTTVSATYTITQANVGVVNNASKSGITQVGSVSNITGTAALTKMPDLFKYQNENSEYINYWAITSDGAPVLESFADTVDKTCMGVDLSWYNSGTNYTLSNAADFYGFTLMSQTTDFRGKTITLSDHITINEGNADEWSEVAPDFGWLSIGVSKQFAGTFDGNMKKISGVYLVATGNMQGLFGVTTSSAKIQNVQLVNSYLKSSNTALGSILGRANGGEYYNIYSDATVDSSNIYVGGIMGQVNSGNSIIMDNCWFAGSVTGTNEIGGIIGRINGGATITNCLNTGDVTSISTNATPYVGGLFGRTDSSSTATIKYCLNTKEVNYNTEKATSGYGTVLGGAYSSTTFNNTYTITQANVGVVNNASKSGITQVGSESNITGTAALTKMPDLFKYQNENSEYVNYWAITSDGAPVLESFADIADKTCMGVDLSWYNSGTNYTLSNAADFYGFTLMSQATNFSGKIITLGDHITINAGSPYGADGEKDAADEANPDDWSMVAPDFGWLSIGAGQQFAGTFDGNMKTISGVYLSEAANNRGLFVVTTSNAVIQNVKLTDSYFKNTKPGLGSIVGRANGGEFYNIYSNAIVDSTDVQVGGIMGMVNGGYSITMDNCWSAGPVTGKTEVGGIIGRISGTATVTNCLNSGDITSSSTAGTLYVGGLFGSKANNGTSTATIRYCLNLGEVLCSQASGVEGYAAVIGKADGTTTIEHTYATTESCGVYATGNVTVDGQHSNWQVSKDEIKGKDAKDKMPSLFNILLTTKWDWVEDKTPVLKDFK